MLGSNEHTARAARRLRLAEGGGVNDTGDGYDSSSSDASNDTGGGLGSISASGGEHSNRAGPSAEVGDLEAMGQYGYEIGPTQGFTLNVNPTATLLGAINPLAGVAANVGMRAFDIKDPLGFSINFGGGPMGPGYTGPGAPDHTGPGSDIAGGYDPNTGAAPVPLTPPAVQTRPPRHYDPLSSDPATYGLGPAHLFLTAARGGRVPFAFGGAAGEGHHRGAGHLIDDPSPGRADLVATTVPANSYIIPADVVSGLGQGNTDAGARRLRRMLAKVPPRSSWSAIRMVPVRLSGGEYQVPPGTVAGLGGGSPTRGALVLEELVRAVRDRVSRHMRAAPPPKR
jgi:hypothetical protein